MTHFWIWSFALWDVQIPAICDKFDCKFYFPCMFLTFQVFDFASKAVSRSLSKTNNQLINWEKVFEQRLAQFRFVSGSNRFTKGCDKTEGGKVNVKIWAKSAQNGIFIVSAGSTIFSKKKKKTMLLFQVLKYQSFSMMLQFSLITLLVHSTCFYREVTIKNTIRWRQTNAANFKIVRTRMKRSKFCRWYEPQLLSPRGWS